MSSTILRLWTLSEVKDTVKRASLSFVIAVLMVGFGGKAPLAGDDAMRSDGMAVYVNPQDSLPRLRFSDGLISLNDRCMVRKAKLNRRLPPIYVSGEPVGFC